MKTIAIMFPGQGSQYITMAKQYYDEYEYVREIFNKASEITKIDIKKLCFEGDINELKKTENCQVAVLTCSYAAYKVYENMVGVKPVYACGNSLGEYSALVASGVIDFEDALQIVKCRGEFMRDASLLNEGMMVAINGMDVQKVHDICLELSNEKECAVISNYNCKNQVVISGNKSLVSKVIEELTKNKINFNILDVSGAFHSPLMSSAKVKMEELLKDYKFKEMEFPVISNVTGKPYESSDEIKKMLINQVVEPVQWSKTMEFLQMSEVDVLIDMGPKSILANLSRRNYDTFITYAFDKNEEREKIFNDYKGNDNFNLKDLIDKCLCIAVSTQNKNFNNNEYDELVVNSYKQILKVEERFESGKISNIHDEVKFLHEMLKNILCGKKLNRVYQETLLKEINEEFNIEKFISE